MPPSLNVLHVASEVAPFAKSGGLADVASALPRALASLGDRVAIVTPRYRTDPDRFGLARRLTSVSVSIGATPFEIAVFDGRLPGGGGEVRALLLDHPLFDRPGLYHEAGIDYADNALRFALLSRGALAAAESVDFRADVVHAHDWQAAPSLLHARRGALPTARTVLTIHNLAFQGNFPPQEADPLWFGADLFHPEGIEFYGNVSFLKAGILFADRITTVSPTYAREIQTEPFGCGMDGLLKANADRLVGILNGADYDAWSPERDPVIAERYSGESLAGKRACKAALQRELGLPPRPRTPLLGAVTRLSDQKGFDLLADAIEPLLAERDLQIAILGDGDAALVERIEMLAKRFPLKVALRHGLDEALAHRMYAGSDLFVMPSRYEPCGLAQLYAMRYGAPPIVRATGGLDDTIVDYDAPTRSGTGFKFQALKREALTSALLRALAAYSDEDRFTSLIQRAMAQDFSWARSAAQYRQLYRR